VREPGPDPTKWADEPIPPRRWLVPNRIPLGVPILLNGIPSISAYHECAVAGGLMAYTASYYDIFRREATFIDKIFKGAKPGDLPVEQATKFEFVINLKSSDLPTAAIAEWLPLRR
jgi:ABC transporter substrate binding protein